jgi:hypothetical protein
LDGDAVGEAVIDRMIGTAVNMMETYLPAFMSVVYGNEEPEGMRFGGWRRGFEQAPAAFPGMVAN